MSIRSQNLATLSLAGLAAAYNAAIENHSLPVSPVAKFASKAIGIAKCSHICTEYGLEAEVVNDEVALVRQSAETFEPEEETDAPEAPPVAEAAAPSPETFQRLPKDQLPAKGTPERAAYRKARRAAARARKKAAA